MRMDDVVMFERLADRVSAGEALQHDELARLAATPDILQLGMLADGLRRRLRGTQVTFVRVARVPFTESFADTVSPAAGEVRITGAPDSLKVAVAAVTQAKAVAGERLVSGFSWRAIDALAVGGETVSHVLKELRAAGLEAVGEVPLDLDGDLAAALEHLVGAGFQRVRLTLDRAGAAQRMALLAQARQLQERFGCVQAINPLASVVDASGPTTGYDDVKMVSMTRLAVPAIPSVQVDWQRYGPKLAQVALTFGADDLDGVPASDAAPEGRRRAPLEEVRRNIETAGFTPVERDGRFRVIA